MFIEANLPLVPVPGIPEIRLHKASPASGLHRLSEQDAGFASPYWAYHWAGGLALARFILDQPGKVASRRVLDLGAGSGLVAIAAARAGAAHVAAAEVDRYAVAALALNARQNGVRIDIHHTDVTGEVPPPVDVVLAGDVFYAPDIAARMIRFLDRCVDAGIEVLIGDPWRASLPTARLSELAHYQVCETTSAITKASGVFAFH